MKGLLQLVLLAIQLQSALSCSNSPLKFLHTYKSGKKIRKKCSWVAQKAKRCNIAGVASHCPETCNACDTVGDSTMKFKVQLEPGEKFRTKRCPYIAQEPSTRCALNGVADTCRSTCATTTPGTVVTGKSCNQNSDCVSNYCDPTANRD